MTDRSKDPYGVPTGTVPRVSVSGYQRTEPLPPGEFNPRPCPDCGVPHGEFHKVDCPRRGRNPVTGERSPLPPDPVVKAVDDWLLMERKARAWDMLLVQTRTVKDDTPIRPAGLLALMATLVQESNHVR